MIVTPGTYRLEFYVYSAAVDRPAARTCVKYEVTEDIEAALISCVVNAQTRTVDRSVRIQIGPA